MIWEQHIGLDKRLLELEAEGLTQAEIAQRLSVDFNIILSRDAVKNRLSRVVRNNLADLPVTEIMPYFKKCEAVVRGDAATPKKIDLKAYFDSLEHGKKRALAIGDTHCPFEDKEKLQHAIDLGRGADVVVITGDLSDMHAISRFLKERSIPLETEIDGICRFFEYMSKVFDGVPVICVQSNHNLRVAKNIVMPQSLEFLVRKDLLVELARPFPNVVVWDDWFVQICDSLFCHSETNSKVPARPVVEVYEWFLHRGKQLGIKTFTTLIEAHTHHLAVIHADGPVKLFEGGCLCQEMPYSRRDSKYMRGQSNGCVVLTWLDGISILNQCREHVL